MFYACSGALFCQRQAMKVTFESMKAKKVSFIIFILLAMVALIGYYLYNKGPVNVKDANAIKVDAIELYNDFIKDSVIAQQKYSGKILSVAARVSSSTVNQQNETLILLSTDVAAAFINCTMEEKEIKVAPGQQVIIKGICSGIGQGDADLGIAGDVYLSRCYLIK